MNRIQLLMLGLSLLPGLVQAGNWRIDQAQSRLGFQYRAMGAPVEGEFHRYLADIQWDANQPASAHIRLDVDTGSIDAGLPDATAEAAKNEFFDSRRYPWARFVSTAVQPQGKGRYLLQGTLTIKGITRPVSLPILIQAAGPAQQLKGTFVLKRLDFGIGQGQWTDPSALANEVPVAFSLRLMPANPPPR
jgi:polyisoprenoid-binding protein YceI